MSAIRQEIHPLSPPLEREAEPIQFYYEGENQRGSQGVRHSGPIFHDPPLFDASGRQRPVQLYSIVREFNVSDSEWDL